MPKILNCEVCLMCAQDPSLVCAVHPYGQNSDFCPDFRPDPTRENVRFQDFLGLQLQQPENSDEPFNNPFSQNPDEEQWEPEGATYYNGELILQPKKKTREKQLWLLDNHPLFTGICPQCGTFFERNYQARVHWDCACGWMDDSI